MKTKKQITKERTYWEEYDKFLNLIGGEVLIQYLKAKDSKIDYLKEMRQ